MKRFLTIFAAAAALLVAGCQKAEVEDNLNIGSSTIVVSNAGATQDIVFTANTDWTIASDQAWVTFDREKGAAGKVTVTLTIAANEGTDDRSAKVTVKAGTKETVFNIEQKATTGFASAIEYKIDGTAQDITIDVKYNVDYTVTVDESSSWLSVTKTKAAIQEGSIVIHADANPQFNERVGSFIVSGPGFEQVYSVCQGGGETKAISASGRYVGIRGYLYGDSAYQTALQYIIDMETEDGNTVSVALNIGEVVDNPLALPVGRFIADGLGTMASGTFSVAGYLTKFYTTITTAGEVVAAQEGEVNISAEGDDVTISAALVGEDGITYFCVYKGPFEEAVKDDFEVMTIPSYDKPKFNSCTNTYYKTKANEWTITFWATAAPSDDVPALAFMPVTLYSEAGDPASLEIPEGTYTFTDVERDWSKNGNSDFAPGTFTISMNTSDQVFYKVLDKDATLTLTKNEDGTYKFVLDAKIGDGYYYDDDYNQVNVDGTYDYYAAWDNIVIPVAEEGTKPYPDADAEVSFCSVPSYSGFYFGEALGEGYNVFLLQCNYIDAAFNMYIPLSVAADAWVFEDNVRANYCNTPLPEGVYSFSYTVGDKKLLPLLYNGGNNYRTITNTWAGVTYVPTGGSVTFSSAGITFNLEVTPVAGGDTRKITGTVAMGLQALRNYSANAMATRLTLAAKPEGE